MRWQLGRAVDIGDVDERRQLVDLGVDIHLVSLDERPATGAIPQHGSRSQECIPDVTGVDPLGPDPALNGRKRIGAQHDLGDEPERAERADDELGEVEAADVLHDRTTAGDDLAFGRHVPDLQNGVACRPATEAVESVLSDSDCPAHGAAPVGQC